MIEVLLVDDETYVTESLYQTIPWKNIGVSQVHRASSAPDALQLLEKQAIDILITDIKMPVMSGLELIDTVSEHYPNIRSILLTGYSDFEYTKKAIQLKAFDYLLKPVVDDEFITCVTNAIESLKDEWENVEMYSKLMHNRESDMSILRASLLHDLLLGKKMSSKLLQEKLIQYEIPLQIDASAAMMLIRLGKRFTSMDHHSISLMEYAVGNIAEEVFGDDFNLWYSKAPHECHVIVAQSKNEDIPVSGERFESNVRMLREHVSNYLKGDISIIVTPELTFPDEMPASYRAGLSSMFLIEGNAESTVFIQDTEKDPFLDQYVRSIDELYKPPTLIHLLESKQWDAAEEKIVQVFEQLERTRFTREHLYEVFLSVSNALMYIAHKEGRFITEIDHSVMDFVLDQSMINSLEKLRVWILSRLEKLREELIADDVNTRCYITRQVKELVSSDLGQDTSVKSIADRVYMHPVYLSKIFKAETGENLSDYIIRMKMERAFYLLKHTNKKIYEISYEIGYQNPQYFSKIFKKHYGFTPNEFRDQ